MGNKEKNYQKNQESKILVWKKNFILTREIVKYAQKLSLKSNRKPE